MEFSRFLGCLDTDAARLRAVAAADLTAVAPT
jgi:hypothetical protein